MDALVGSDFTRSLTWYDQGLPVTGAAGTYGLYSPAGTSLGALPLLEVGNGEYSVSGDGALLARAGVYTGRVVLALGGLNLSTTDRFQVGYWQPGLIPRWELVHRVARQVQDLWLGQVTSVVGFTQFGDTERWEPTHYFQGAQVYFYAGTGRGQARRIQSYLNAAPHFTVGTSLGQQPGADTLYQCHKKFTLPDYWDALNRAIARVRSHALIPMSDESLATIYTANVPTREYPIPAGLDYLSRVQWKDTTNADADWADLDMATKDWDVLPGARLWLPTVYQDRAIRLIGQMLPGDLSHDDAWCTMDPEYVVPQAAAFLLEQRVHSVANDAEDARGRMSYLQSIANQRAPNGRPWPNSIRVM